MNKQLEPIRGLWKTELAGLALCSGPDFAIETVNSAFTSLLGCEANTVLNQSFSKVAGECGCSDLADLLLSSQEGRPFIYQHGRVFVLVSWQRFFPPYSTDAEMHQKELVVLQVIPDHCINVLTGKMYQDFEELLDSIADGVWVIDSMGTTLRVNKAMTEMTELHADELVGLHVSAPMLQGKYSACVTLRALEEKKPVTMFDDYGNGKRFLNTSTPVLDATGKVTTVVACVRDIAGLETLHRDLAALENKFTRDRARLKQDHNNGEYATFIGVSPAMERLQHDIRKAARVDSVALVLGETGSGKSLAASAIHQASPRSAKPFVAINCGAIPASLMESELFGYEKGAFTGAHRDGKIGLFEAAKGGTVFLDEIGELPLAMQVKLLHVLDGNTFTRVGGVVPQRLEARILAATNKPLEEMVRQKAFREDLYYRLNVLNLRIPPLRDRKQDIQELARYFFALANERNNLNKTLAPEVFTYLMHYHWPGNVRELRAIIEYLVAMTEKHIITAMDLPEHIRDVLPPGGKKNALKQKKFTYAVEAFEKSLIEAALRETGSTWKAAKQLGISQSTVVRKAQRYKIGIAEIVHQE